MRLVVPALLLLLASPAAGAPIAFEGFDYAPGELDGAAGGAGFTGAWSAETALTEVADPGAPLAYSAPGISIDGGDRALRITGNDPSLAFRPLAAIADDEVFVSFLFRYSGALQNNDFAVLWHDTTSSGDHTNRPNLGVKTNRGSGAGPEDALARIQLSGAGQVYSTDLAPDRTYLIVGRLWKSSPGPAGDYDRFDLWVDPSAGDAGSPDGTASGVGSLSGFSWLGLRTANLDPGDVFWIDELGYATSFAEVVPAPEPSTLLLLGSGLLAIALVRRRAARS